MSRTICGAALGLSLAVAAGCGSKAEPPPADVKLEPAAPAPTADAPQPPPKADAPGAPNPPAPAPGPAWEIDQAKHAIPNAPVRGRIAGTDVTPTAILEGTELTFCTYKADTPKGESPVVERSAKLNLTPMLVPGQPVPGVFGRKWAVKDGDPPGPGVPVAWFDVPVKGAHMFPAGYALTLELGARKGNTVPGKVYLCLNDPDRTVLAGTFEAAYLRPAAEPPGPSDVPYVGGTVALADPKAAAAEVRLGYAALTAAGSQFPEFKLPFAAPAGTELPPIRVGTSTFVAGDGARPFRYEHVKLAPGRYLLTAAVPGGPTAWRWVDVAADTARTENVVLGPAAGGIEVSVPADTGGTAFAAPADDPARPPLDASTFQLIALQVARQGADVTAGKATLKNLAPGRYEVRVGDLRGFAEVTAGKTAELTLTPPKK